MIPKQNLPPHTVRILLILLLSVLTASTSSQPEPPQRGDGGTLIYVWGGNLYAETVDDTADPVAMGTAPANIDPTLPPSSYDIFDIQTSPLTAYAADNYGFLSGVWSKDRARFAYVTLEAGAAGYRVEMMADGVSTLLVKSEISAERGYLIPLGWKSANELVLIERYMLDELVNLRLWELEIDSGALTLIHTQDDMPLHGRSAYFSAQNSSLLGIDLSTGLGYLYNLETGGVSAFATAIQVTPETEPPAEGGHDDGTPVQIPFIVGAAPDEQVDAFVTHSQSVPHTVSNAAQRPPAFLYWPLEDSQREISFYPDAAWARNNGKTYYNGHQGTDVEMPIGTPVYAAAYGTVARSFNGCPEHTQNYPNLSVVPANCPPPYVYPYNAIGKGYHNWGNAIYMSHTVTTNGNNQTWYTAYGHLKQNSLSAIGTTAAPGQQIALSGHSGASEGPHLHFEIRNSDTYTGWDDPWGSADAPYGATLWIGGTPRPTTGVGSCIGFDVTPPTGRYTSPTNNSNVSTSAFLAGTAADGCGVREVRFTASWAGVGWHVIHTDTSAPYEYVWNLCASGVPTGTLVQLGIDITDTWSNTVYSPEGTRHITMTGSCSPPPPPDQRVLLCRNNDYTSCGLVQEDFTFIGDGWNDLIQSIKVEGDYSWVVFQDANYSGGYWTGDTSQQNVLPWQISSVRVRRRATNLAFTLYDLANRTGEAWSSDRTIWNLIHWGKDNFAESMRVYAGYEVIACEHSDFQGNCGRVVGPADFNDINTLAQGLSNGVSSLYVCAAGACPIPNAPADLNVTSINQTGLTLNWTDNTNLETAYHVYQWNGSEYALIGTVGRNSTSFPVTGLFCGSKYLFEVSASWPAGESAHSWVNATTSDCPTPNNNDFNGAVAFSATPYSAAQNTTGATTAADDPSFACQTYHNGKGYGTVWYRYVPTAPGLLTINTFGSEAAYDTVLAVWTGNQGALQLRGCNDDASGWGTKSQLEVPVAPGMDYFIEVAGYASNDVGSLKLTMHLRPDIFADVPTLSKEWMEPFIEYFYVNGITGGCGSDPLRYCPEDPVTRGAMAVFLLRAMNYPDLPHTPPTPAGLFDDLPVPGKEWQEAWIEEFYSLGITGGCGQNPLRYCPEQSVTRAAMAVFILRALEGPDYVPDPSPNIFSDLPVAGKEWMEPWVNEFYERGITGGCGVSPLRFCPENPVTRGAMAVFILRAFENLPQP